MSRYVRYYAKSEPIFMRAAEVQALRMRASTHVQAWCIAAMRRAATLSSLVRHWVCAVTPGHDRCRALHESLQCRLECTSARTALARNVSRGIKVQRDG